MRSAMVMMAEAALCGLLGVMMALLLSAACLMANLDTRTLPGRIWFSGGRIPWSVVEVHGLGVRWINASRGHAPLLGEVEEGERPPGWAIDLWGPVQDLPPTTRMAALAGGWPFPAIARGWTTSEAREIFPPPAEFDLAISMLDRGRDRFIEGGWGSIRLLPWGVALDAMPWVAASMWLLRRSRLSRRAAAARPTAPAR